MEKQFEVRTFGFGELAQLYFPYVTKTTASHKLSEWIRSSPQLMKKLSELNWRKRAKYFTPKQVRTIIEHFDPPF
ncbi:MAG TPA: DUF4248 domain-containing protein [Bacteroidales bacterium]